MSGVLIADNSLLGCILITAGLGKVVGPAPLRAAFAELFEPAGRIPLPALRLVAGIEAAAGAALLVGPARAAAAAAAAVFGFCFAALGALGMRLGAAVPCGCAGGAGRRPLGPVNVGVGCVLMVGALANYGGLGGPHLTGGYTRYALVCGAVGVQLACLFVHRSLIRELLPMPRRKAMP